METIIDIGKRGAEGLDDYQAPQAETLTNGFDILVDTVKRFPAAAIEDEVAGSKRKVAVRQLMLHNEQVFGLLHSLAPYEPMVYAKQAGSAAVLGMLSPNYDDHGGRRLPTLKVLPLQQAMPLTSKFLPSAEMATMLAGASNAEGQGVGGHSGNIADDFEHRITMFGALSVGKPSLATSHANHQVRQKSSVAAGLTNGKLGNLYVPDADNGRFPGFGEPLTFHAETAAPGDMIYIPDSFLDSEEAFGSYYDEASRIMLGAGMKILYDRTGLDGETVISDKIKQLGKEL